MLPTLPGVVRVDVNTDVYHFHQEEKIKLYIITSEDVCTAWSSLGFITIKMYIRMRWSSLAGVV